MSLKHCKNNCLLITLSLFFVQVYESDTELRIATLTEGLNNELRNKLRDLLKHSKENALNIFDYLQSFKNEINPSTFQNFNYL